MTPRLPCGDTVRLARIDRPIDVPVLFRNGDWVVTSVFVRNGETSEIVAHESFQVVHAPTGFSTGHCFFSLKKAEDVCRSFAWWKFKSRGSKEFKAGFDTASAIARLANG